MSLPRVAVVCLFITQSLFITERAFSSGVKEQWMCLSLVESGPLVGMPQTLGRTEWVRAVFEADPQLVRMLMSWIQPTSSRPDGRLLWDSSDLYLEVISKLKSSSEEHRNKIAAFLSWRIEMIQEAYLEASGGESFAFESGSARPKSIERLERVIQEIYADEPPLGFHNQFIFLTEGVAPKIEKLYSGPKPKLPARIEKSKPIFVQHPLARGQMRSLEVALKIAGVESAQVLFQPELVLSLIEHSSRFRSLLIELFETLRSSAPGEVPVTDRWQSSDLYWKLFETIYYGPGGTPRLHLATELSVLISTLRKVYVYCSEARPGPGRVFVHPEQMAARAFKPFGPKNEITRPSFMGGVADDFLKAMTWDESPEMMTRRWAQMDLPRASHSQPR